MVVILWYWTRWNDWWSYLQQVYPQPRQGPIHCINRWTVLYCFAFRAGLLTLRAPYQWDATQPPLIFWKLHHWEDLSQSRYLQQLLFLQQINLVQMKGVRFQSFVLSNYRQLQSNDFGRPERASTLRWRMLLPVMPSWRLRLYAMILIFWEKIEPLREFVMQKKWPSQERKFVIKVVSTASSYYHLSYVRDRKGEWIRLSLIKI